MQIYGYSYDLRKGGAHRVEDLPSWAQQLAVRLERDRLMLDVADQLIVNDYSVGQGIPPQRLVAAGHAANAPLEPGTSEAARARNRRIEIRLTSR